MLYKVCVLASVVLGVAAQQGEWQQCGGQGWTGATTCVSGTVCTFQNAYYSQCLPGASTVKTTSPASTPTTAPGSPPPAKANYWFSFGDSYTTTGFNSTNGALPSLSNPLGNPDYPGYTGGGGANWVDYLTLTNNNSLLFTYNYAYGGATIDANLVTPYLPTVLSVVDQVNLFLSGAAKKPASTPWTSQNSLFSMWIGINDIGNSYYNSGDRNAFSDTLLDRLFGLIQQLYTAGGRNFLFVNVPPVDRSPLMLAQPASAQAAEKTVIDSFNAKLASRVTAFKANNTGVTTWLWDSNAVFTQILNNPQSFGFMDATTYGTGSNIFWGNNYHPGVSAHAIFAKDVAQLLAGTVW